MMIIAIIPVLIGVYLLVYRRKHQFSMKELGLIGPIDEAKRQLQDATALLKSLSETSAQVLSHRAAAESELKQHDRTMEIIRQIGATAQPLVDTIVKGNKPEKNGAECTE